MRWVEHAASSPMGEKRGAYLVLVGKTEGKRPLGRPKTANYATEDDNYNRKKNMGYYIVRRQEITLGSRYLQHTYFTSSMAITKYQTDLFSHTEFCQWEVCLLILVCCKS